MLREGGFGDETVVHQFLAGFAETAVAHVGFPDVEDFCDGVTLEELDVGDDVEQGGLVHPVRERDHLGGGMILLSIRLQLLLILIRIDMHNPMRRYRIILIKNQLLLVLALKHHLQIIRSEPIGIDDLYTVDELDGGCVTVLSEEGDGVLACEDAVEDVGDGFIHE